MKLWHRNAAGQMMEILFDYVRAVDNIPSDVYLDIRQFLQYFCFIPDSGLENFWTSNDDKIMRHIQVTLLEKLEKNYEKTTDDAKRSNIICLKLCLAICVHPGFQKTMQQIANGVKFLYDFQLRLTQIILQMFVRKSAQFELNDEFFIKKLREFMHLPKQRDILAYVIIVLIFFTTYPL